MKRLVWYIAVFAVATLLCTPALMARTGHGDSLKAEIVCDETALYCPVSSKNELTDALAAFETPQVAAPTTPIVTPVITVRKPITRTVTYSVATRGTITSDLATFKVQANATLNDQRGWSRLGVKFSEVTNGGDFTLYLSEASQVPSFSSGCSAEYSCNVGRDVIINQDRWEGATKPWNDVGGGIRDYRHMVVNHETGHWLGHGHENCPAAGQAAPVMQQQSINLQGCKFNPWPLDSEIWSSRLGI